MEKGWRKMRNQERQILTEKGWDKTSLNFTEMVCLLYTNDAHNMRIRRIQSWATLSVDIHFKLFRSFLRYWASSSVFPWLLKRSNGSLVRRKYRNLFRSRTIVVCAIAISCFEHFQDGRFDRFWTIASSSNKFRKISNHGVFWSGWESVMFRRKATQNRNNSGRTFRRIDSTPGPDAVITFQLSLSCARNQMLCRMENSFTLETTSWNLSGEFWLTKQKFYLWTTVYTEPGRKLVKCTSCCPNRYSSDIYQLTWF